MRAVPEGFRLSVYMKRMSAEPHHAGSPGSRAVAEYAAGLLREWGIDARIESFEALLPYPTARSLEMIEPVRYLAKLKEFGVTDDPPLIESLTLPTYNAYSADGDVTAPLVYVNYGTPEDYETLKRNGVNVRGKIVIARYGAVWRGTKAKVAQENGAAGCLIYSDPRDDGYFQGDVYPMGAFRPPDGVQRGSIMDMPLYVGDPLTPGWASIPGARKLPLTEAPSIMKIPVLPISYDDASHLLQQLKGPVAAEAWRGALGFTYHLGPGPAKVRLKVESDWSTKPVHNVIARIPGSVYPDQWVLYGNHHDAWVNGANDPASGASALLETARTLATLTRRGWKPKRSILFALWDAEEFGLVGSTEWVEKHKTELDQKLVAYLNSDSTGMGRLSGGGSHTLESFYREVLRDVPHPLTGKPLLEPRVDRKAPEAEQQRLAPLGAGSDYVAFLHHAGIASLNLGFGAEGGGVYHSIHDTFDWYSRFSDGDFVFGRAFTGLMATLLVRLSDSALVPFDFQSESPTLQRYLAEIVQQAGNPSPRLNTKELWMEFQKLAATTKVFETDYQAAVKHAGAMPPEKLAAVNQMIYRTERAFVSGDGLAGRKWYRHQVHAPGMYTGYVAKTLPGIREAAEGGRWDEANVAAADLAKSLRTLTSELTRISAALRGSMR